MDVRLQNAYVEVLLNNFIEVVKQNLLLQAQHEVNKNGFKEAEYTVEKFKEISDNNIVYQNKLTENDNTINQLNNRVNQLITERDDIKLLSAKNYTDKQEKDRLQSAVNDYMRQLKTAQEELSSFKKASQDVLLQNNNRIEELTRHIIKLESVSSVNKVKKVKLGEIAQLNILGDAVEIEKLPMEYITNDIVKAGGTF